LGADGGIGNNSVASNGLAAVSAPWPARLSRRTALTQELRSPIVYRPRMAIWWLHHNCFGQPKANTQKS
jgi:hypothetical protein